MHKKRELAAVTRLSRPGRSIANGLKKRERGSRMRHRMPRIPKEQADEMVQALMAYDSTAPLHATELDLAKRAGGGDQRAFEAIMRRNNRALYRAARSILRDDSEAEDAVQEAYIRAYHALADFRGGSSLSTWLTRIVVNKSLERLRQRKREVATVSCDNVINLEKHLELAHTHYPSPEIPEQALMREQTRKLLEQKIDELPSAFRTVFVLRALEEMTVEECAACLDIPEITVRTRFFRARRLLRKALAREMDVVADGAFAFDGERCDRIVAAVLARIVSPPNST
jgi:RNA polymerase sigma-70 factor (ECF subfamily)